MTTHKIKMLLIVTLFSFALFSALAYISFANIAIVCKPCYINSCQCVSNCTNGTMYVYNTQTCAGIFNYSYNVSNGISNWQPPVSQNYSLRILCDDENQSSCTTVLANIQPTTPTTTTTSGGGNWNGGGPGCIYRGDYCYYSTQCCNSLNCVNNTCSNANITTTTTTISTTTSSQTSTITNSSTTTTTTTTARNPLGFSINAQTIALIMIILFVIIIAIILVFYIKSRNANKTKENHDKDHPENHPEDKPEESPEEREQGHDDGFNELKEKWK